MTTNKVRLPDRYTDRRTDRHTLDKVIHMCRYVSQATQKPFQMTRQWWGDLAVTFMLKYIIWTLLLTGAKSFKDTYCSFKTYNNSVNYKILVLFIISHTKYISNHSFKMSTYALGRGLLYSNEFLLFLSKWNSCPLGSMEGCLMYMPWPPGVYALRVRSTGNLDLDEGSTDIHPATGK